jgi:hypothetical protein
MLLPRISLHRTAPLLRTSCLRQISRSKVPLQSFRGNSTSSAAPKYGTKRPSKLNAFNSECLCVSNIFKVFPERLLVYHAGTGRSVFLGCLKVTTIFIFTFFTLVVVPTHFFAEHEPLWVAGAGELF